VVAASNLGVAVLGRDQPSSVFGAAEMSRKAGARIESRSTKPVNRPSEADERHSLAVAYERVILNSPTQDWADPGRKRRGLQVRAHRVRSVNHFVASRF
jgi:hypothetical protein